MSILSAPAESKSLLERLSAEQQHALHDWSEQQAPVSGMIDLMAWPGWAELALQKLKKSV